MKGYFKQYGWLWLATLLVWLFFHVYFLVLCSIAIPLAELLYVDVLLAVCLGALFCYSLAQWLRLRKKEKEIMKEHAYIFANEIEGAFADKALFAYNEKIYEQAQEEAYQKQQELQEYIARWSHEIKLPLAAIGLMNERNEDSVLRYEMKEQIQKMEQLLHTMLTGCKTWELHYDKVINQIDIKEAVQKSIRHQSFFLIKEHFEVVIQENVKGKVLSDEQWLVYILDQVISNAIKYHGTHAKLEIFLDCSGNQTRLHIKDYGMGIKQQDLNSIFDKGYTGENMRNGEYRSTGMGLYFVKKIVTFLGHDLKVCSIESRYTDFILIFNHHLDYFNVTDL